MKLKYTIAALAVTTFSAQAAITVTKDAGVFGNTYTGAEIYDGSAYVSPWNEAGGSANPTLVGSIATITTSGSNGWFQQDNGTSPWETGTLAGGSWTLEVEASVSAVTGAGALAIWGANGSERFIWHVTPTGSGEFLAASGSEDNTVSTTWRVAYDSVDDDYSVWRNGVLKGDSFGQQAGTGSTRLIIGDCCGNGDHLTAAVSNVSFDTTGAFAPVPEPSSTALLGLGGLALILRRRK
ncbi:MAG: PEP-CTERM sorting domain-containing protein [Akkermansiaceae bacterium]